MSFIYLASPYTHPDPAVVEERVKAAADVVVECAHRRLTILSPVVYMHELAKFHDLPKTWEFWSTLDLRMLDAADALWVLTLDGWEKSIGIQGELDYARFTMKQITYYRDVKEVIQLFAY